MLDKFKYNIDPKVSKASYLAEQITKYENINRAQYVYHQACQRLKDKYDKDMTEERQKLQLVQSTCDHPDKHYCGDPAGGSDSCHTCNICGKVLD